MSKKKELSLGVDPEPEVDPDTEFHPDRNSRSPYRTFVGALRAMICFFTVFRVRQSEDDVMEDIECMETHFWLAPVIGFIVGFIAMMVAASFGYLTKNSFVAIVFAIGTVFAISKFLHLDGLVDFGDSLVATGDTEKRIRALKDTNIGAGGMGVALIVTMISIASGSTLGIFMIPVFWAAEIFAKNTMVVTAAKGLPGSGMASKQVEATTKYDAMTSTLLTVVLSFIVIVAGVMVMDLVDLTPYNYSDIVLPKLLPALLAAMVVTFIVGRLIARTANRNLGFVNGDILGAANEMGRAACLITFLIVLKLLDAGIAGW